MDKKEIIFKYLKLTIILIVISFTVYKIFNWKVIFDREYESAQIVRHEPVLPPVIPHSSSTAHLSYDQKLYIERIIKALKSRDINITQVEETEIGRDVKLRTSEDYYIFISTEIDNDLLISNIFNVYDSDDFQKDKKQKTTKSKEEEVITITTNADNTASSSSSTTATETISTSTVKSKGFEYVDFRFGDKVYYR